MARRYTKQEVADIVEQDGLEDAIADSIEAEAIEDQKLSRAWAKARAALNEIEQILEA
jgi:hypothetical protein